MVTAGLLVWAFVVDLGHAHEGRAREREVAQVVLPERERCVGDGVAVFGRGWVAVCVSEEKGEGVSERASD